MAVNTNELKKMYEHLLYMLYPFLGTFTFIFPFNPSRNPVRKLYLRDLLVRLLLLLLLLLFLLTLSWLLLSFPAISLDVDATLHPYLGFKFWNNQGFVSFIPIISPFCSIWLIIFPFNYLYIFILMVLECLLCPIQYRDSCINQIDLLSKGECFRLFSMITSQAEKSWEMKTHLLKKFSVSLSF